jgi:hypothetical protein
MWEEEEIKRFKKILDEEAEKLAIMLGIKKEKEEKS